MDGQQLQEAEKEREGLPASPALSDISVFSALYTTGMDGQLLQEAEKEREGLPASPALSDISVFSAL
jgi:hypothetical protein